MTFAAAESCTGGIISREMTEFSGSSDVFWGGFVTYSNEAKIAMLSVDPVVLDTYGAVSEETVIAMAEGVISRSGVDCSVSVSGIAGPGGGTETKPVGTVWICAALKSGIREACKFQFSGSRSTVRSKAAESAIMMIYKLILDNNTIDSK